MQLFINNWSASLATPVTDSALSLSVDPLLAGLFASLSGGAYYLLTLAEVNPLGTEVAWETVKVTAHAGGLLTVERGFEGAPRAWPADTPITARATAATLAALRDAAPPALELVPAGGAAGQVLTAGAGGARTWQTPAAGGGGGGAPTVLGTAHPTEAPPALGAHFVYGDSVYIAVDTAHPEHWRHLLGPRDSQGVYVAVGSPGSILATRMARQFFISAGGTPGAVLPVVAITLPQWQVSPGTLLVDVRPEVAGLDTKLTLDFGSAWVVADLLVAPMAELVATRAGNVLSLTLSAAAQLSLYVEVYPSGAGRALYVEMRAAPSANFVFLD